MRTRHQSSIFSTGVKFRPDYGLLLELHALTLLVARFYALLKQVFKHKQLHCMGVYQTAVLSKKTFLNYSRLILECKLKVT